MPTLFHIAERDAWDASRGSQYAPASLAREGFVHCSTRAQVLASADLYFRGRRDLVLLELDERALGDALRWEPPSGTAPRDASQGALFPHVYGAIDPRAVIAAHPLIPRDDGTFTFPASLA